MRTLARLTLTAFALSGLLACGAPAPQEKRSDAAGQDGDEEETVFDDTIETQERARAVEDLTLGRKSDVDEALEKAEGNGAPDEP